MSKAEERAQYSGYGTDPLNRAEYTANEVRDAFIDGYQQAEKDLELTWEDMLLLADIEQDVFNHSDSPLKGVQAAYEEVLKRFKEQKGERHKDENIGI